MHACVTWREGSRPEGRREGPDLVTVPWCRYFLHQWPSLCVFACDGGGTPVGTIVAKVHSLLWPAVINTACVAAAAHELLTDACACAWMSVATWIGGARCTAA
jgi:hypothetical protein